MEEQIQAQRVEEQGSRNLLYSVVKWTLLTMPIPALIALAGIILGAINFASPTHYSPGILAIWFTGDILLIAYVLAHLILLIFMLYEVVSDADFAGMTGTAVVGMLVVLIGGGITLSYRHFAWISVLAFLILIVWVVGDVMFLTTRHKR